MSRKIGPSNCDRDWPRHGDAPPNGRVIMPSALRLTTYDGDSYVARLRGAVRGSQAAMFAEKGRFATGPPR
jgi:hypothetical protein